MEQAKRNELIDSYYKAVDSENYWVFDEIFTESASHIRPGQGSIDGRAEIARFFDEDRRSRGTRHDVTERIHCNNTSYCKVTVTGNLDETAFEGDIISEFRFDLDANRIVQYRVFRGYQR